jgi:CheY-like chemotaxis protein
MIWEDAPDVLKLFELALKPKFNIIPVDSGKECIERFTEEKKRGKKLHLLLLDNNINDMSGDIIGRKIIENNGTSGFKIILISAYNPDDSLLKELKKSSCITKFVKKPIYLSSLIEIVEDTID